MLGSQFVFLRLGPPGRESIMIYQASVSVLSLVHVLLAGGGLAAGTASLVQIRHSRGAQTGRGLAWGAIVVVVVSLVAPRLLQLASVGFSLITQRW